MTPENKITDAYDKISAEYIDRNHDLLFVQEIADFKNLRMALFFY